jgi:hypothetical protein
MAGQLDRGERSRGPDRRGQHQHSPADRRSELRDHHQQGYGEPGEQAVSQQPR